MNEIYWMTVVGNLSTALMVVWIVALQKRKHGLSKR